MNSLLTKIVIAALSLGLSFLGGYCSKGKEVIKGKTIKITDTLKVSPPQFIPTGKKVNIDSLVGAINKKWKDSLGVLYGMGLFSTTARKVDNLGSREYTFYSRIPIDPEGEFQINEDLNLPEIYPKSTIGIFAGIENRFDRNVHLFAGIKYFIVDTKHFQLYPSGEVNYLLTEKKWDGNLRLHVEVKF